jgi:hypothetical protein
MKAISRYQTARMTIPVLVSGGAKRAAPGRDPVNETARMTIPTLVSGARARSRERDRQQDGGARVVGRRRNKMKAIPRYETARLTIPALMSDGATRAAPRFRDRDRKDDDTRVVGRRRNDGGHEGEMQAR